MYHLVKKKIQFNKIIQTDNPKTKSGVWHCDLARSIYWVSLYIVLPMTKLKLLWSIENSNNQMKHLKFNILIFNLMFCDKFSNKMVQSFVKISNQKKPFWRKLNDVTPNPVMDNLISELQF